MRPVTEEEFRAEFQTCGLAEDEYYATWRLLLVLWYSLWWSSNKDWSQYRRRIWDLFSNHITSAARRSSDLRRFLSLFARSAGLRHVGRDERERRLVFDYLALPDDEQRRIVEQFREEMPILKALVQEFTRKHKYNPEENDSASSALFEI